MTPLNFVDILTLEETMELSIEFHNRSLHGIGGNVVICDSRTSHIGTDQSSRHSRTALIVLSKVLFAGEGTEKFNILLVSTCHCATEGGLSGTNIDSNVSEAPFRSSARRKPGLLDVYTMRCKCVRSRSYLVDTVLGPSRNGLEFVTSVVTFCW